MNAEVKLPCSILSSGHARYGRSSDSAISFARDPRPGMAPAARDVSVHGVDSEGQQAYGS